MSAKGYFYIIFITIYCVVVILSSEGPPPIKLKEEDIEKRIKQFENNKNIIIKNNVKYSEDIVKEIMTKNCFKCHHGDNAKGGLQIFAENGKMKEVLPRYRIWDAVDEGRMPPDNVLSDEVSSTLRHWARSVKSKE